MEELMEPIIQIKNVTKTFIGKDNQVEALKGISLDINKGDIYGIIGMSGAGKSTLVRCLNYLEKPTTGTVVVEDQDLSTLTEAELRKVRTGIAMIFQHFNLLMQRSVLDNVCFPMEIVGVKKQAARKRAMELLEIVGLKEKADAYPSQLSGGQKQRVAIARALAMETLCCSPPESCAGKLPRRSSRPTSQRTFLASSGFLHICIASSTFSKAVRFGIRL